MCLIEEQAMLGIEPSKYELILTQNSKSYTVSIPMIRAMIAFATSTVINNNRNGRTTVITTVYMLPLEAIF